jgi:AraC family transcriptional regulator
MVADWINGPLARVAILPLEGGLASRLSYYSPGVAHAPHEHGCAHVSLILAGGFVEEAAGRVRERFAGDSVSRGAGSRHAVRFGPSGALVLNLQSTQPSAMPKLSWEGPPLLGLAQPWSKVANAAGEAPAWLEEARRRLIEAPWRNPVGQLAADLGVHRVHLARAFGAHYGLSPRVFRLRSMVGHALRLALEEDLPLAEAAPAAGFADQSHMSRAVRATCGLPIGRLRSLLSGS